MKLDDGYNQSRGSGTHNLEGYAVEARYNYSEPRKIGEYLLDNRWRRIHFKLSEIGVPPCAPHNRAIAEHGLFGYSAAQALRWWLHAIADADGMLGGICLETRLIRHEIVETYKIEAVSMHGHIHGEDRSNCIPDWGKDG